VDIAYTLRLPFRKPGNDKSEKPANKASNYTLVLLVQDWASPKFAEDKAVRHYPMATLAITAAGGVDTLKARPEKRPPWGLALGIAPKCDDDTAYLVGVSYELEKHVDIIAGNAFVRDKRGTTEAPVWRNNNQGFIGVSVDLTDILFKDE
jgi:hypothetical protein